jgi:hypothetical protein
MSTSFTPDKYFQLKKRYENSSDLQRSLVTNSECPCKTAASNAKANEVTLVNPGNNPGKQLKKENVGVHRRIGMTYGKWRAKIQFPAVLNAEHVWNGITNAFRLISQDPLAQWNERRLCNHPVGYIPANAPSTEGSLMLSSSRDAYSRIDIEILKESENWPNTSYSDTTIMIMRGLKENKSVTVVCSNWDLACHEPANFIIGAQKNVIDGQEFIHHRWNAWHQVVSTKQSMIHDIMMQRQFYYFEIEWQPSKIIWRIGSSPDQMQVICMMDDSMTAIPNNQMLPSVTQEWHAQELWPLAPFNQSFIPFPSKDLVGRIMEVWVE